MSRSLLLQEALLVDACLFEDGAQGAFWHIAGMIGNGGVAVRCRVVPNLMATCCLAVKLQAQRL